MTWRGGIPVLVGAAVSLGMPGVAGAWGPAAEGSEGSPATGAGAVPEAVEPEAAEAEAEADGGVELDPLGQGLVVEVAETMSEHEQVRGWIEERGHEVLGRGGRALERVDLIRVAVKGGPFDYGISLQVRRNGRDLPEQPEPIACACGSEEMLDVVGQAIEAAADRLAEAAVAERQAERAALIAAGEADCRVRVDDAVSSALAVDDEPQRYRVTGLGAGGLVSIGLGSGLFLGGVALTGYFQSSAANWNNGARAMVTIGSLALVGGLTMIIVDIARCKRGLVPCGRLGGESTAWSRRPARVAVVRGGRG